MSETEIDAAREKAAGLRNMAGGVVGQFTPKEITIDISKDLNLGKYGDTAHGLGVFVPAGKFVYGAYIKAGNVGVTSSGAATVALKVGSTTVLGSTPVAKTYLEANEGVAELASSPAFIATKGELGLLVGTADVTAGKLTIGVIYG